jgi:N-acyl homoserine lactone hydrolase
MNTIAQTPSTGMIRAQAKVTETVQPAAGGLEHIPVLTFESHGSSAQNKTDHKTAISASRTTGFSVQTFVCGYVRISPNLAWGGEKCGIVKGSGFFARSSDRVWLPVCSFLVTTPRGRVLVDTAWDRSMSPLGIYDRHAQISSLGSWSLYRINQGMVGPGRTIRERLEALGMKPSDIDYVVISHLDCDHADGLPQMKGVGKVMIADDEMKGAKERGFVNGVRFYPGWWDGLRDEIDLYHWNGTLGPVHKSYDLFGDDSVQMVNIPGHTKGLVATKITNPDGNYVLLFADGGYSSASWQRMIVSGIAEDKAAQRRSLEWIRQQSLDPHCLASMASHDPAHIDRILRF